MLESAFEIDDNIAIYNGYTDGTHWNGWACPWFTKETALEIADAHNALMNEFNALLPKNKSYAIYNETEDTFIFYGYDEAETEDMIQFWFEQLLESTGKSNVDELTVEEIEAEIEDIKGTISNESIVIGVSEFAEHNIKQYEVYLEKLIEMLNNKEEN